MTVYVLLNTEEDPRILIRISRGANNGHVSSLLIHITVQKNPNFQFVTFFFTHFRSEAGFYIVKMMNAAKEMLQN